jgi:diguanylate cyclase (GGDEF)-like protein/PAS domain S-box-containing protein
MKNLLFLRLCLILGIVFLWSEPVYAIGNTLADIPVKDLAFWLMSIILLVCLHYFAKKNKVLEQLVRDNIAKLHSIIYASPIPLALHDEAENIIFVNPSFTQLLGYSQEDIPTLADWWRRTYPNLGQRQQIATSWQMAFNNAKREESQFSPFELTVRCKNGENRTVLLSATTLKDTFATTYLLVCYDITAYKITENSLRESLEILKSVLDNIPMRVFWKDTKGRYLGGNAGFAKDAGVVDAKQLLDKDDYAMPWCDHAERYSADDRLIMNTGLARLNVEEQLTVPNGRVLWLRISKVPLYDGVGRVMGILGIYEDITENKYIAERLHLAASVFANTQEGIVITDGKGIIIDVNQAFTNITGYEREEIIGQNPRILQSGRHNNEFYKELWQTIKDQHYWRGEVWNRRKNGEIYTEWLTISAMLDAEGDIIRYIATFSDISLLKQREQQLAQIAHYDPLTGVPNRILLADRINLAIAQSKRNNCLMAVCYLDLDGFNAVNDSFGHEVGDQLLIDITQRIISILPEEDTLARLGGDEFVCLLQQLERIEDCEHILHRLLQTIKTPFILQGQTITLSASIGVSIFPEDNSSPDTLLRHANQAMYQTKQSGKNAFHIYNIALDKQLHAHRIELDRVERALEKGEFELYFQPKVDMQKGIVFGAEALIRWQDKERGLVMPKDFLPLIENHEMSSRLDSWVIERALQHIEQWQSQGLTIKISVNVSAKSLQSSDFVSKLRSAFEVHPTVDRHCFEIEILETEVINDLEGTSQTIKECQKLGVQFALDDFGTGYSSLSYLRHLPVQTLKIDQSFVRDMLDDEDDLAIVRSVIGLSASFKRQVIAEGVESLAHGMMLMAMGCHLAQGHIIAKPMPADDFVLWLQNWKIPTAWQQTNTD